MASPSAVDRATFVFHNVSDWLKFAELKNGALSSASFAVILLIHQVADWVHPPKFVTYWIWFATACLVGSILVSFASFFSRVRTSNFDLWLSSDENAENPIFFGHIARMSVDDFIRSLGGSNDAELDTLWLRHLCTQTIINSKIAAKKFALFNLGFILFVSAFVTPIGLIFFHWLFCDEKL